MGNDQDEIFNVDGFVGSDTVRVSGSERMRQCSTKTSMDVGTCAGMKCLCACIHL